MNTQDNGFTGDFTMSKFDEDMLIDVLGWVIDKNGMLVEAANVPQKPFALLFELMGATSPVRIVLYDCIGSKPVKDVQTNDKAPVLAGEKMTLTMAPLDFGWITTSKASLTRDDNPTLFDTFFSAVQAPVQPLTP